MVLSIAVKYSKIKKKKLKKKLYRRYIKHYKRRIGNWNLKIPICLFSFSLNILTRV